MAISFVASSTSFSDSQTIVAVNLPTGRAAKDMLIIFIGGKQYNATIATPSGWTSIGTSTNGTTNANVGTGSTKMQAFYRIADGTESATISFSISGGSAAQNVFMGICQAYRTDLASWNTPIGTSLINSAATGWTTIVSGTTLSLPVGCFLPTMLVSNTNATTIGTNPIYSATGKTISFITSSPISAYTTTTGGDGGAMSCYANVTADSNGTAQTLNVIASGSSTEKGHGFVVQLTDNNSETGNFFAFF